MCVTYFSGFACVLFFNSYVIINVLRVCNVFFADVFFDCFLRVLVSFCLLVQQVCMCMGSICFLLVFNDVLLIVFAFGVNSVQVIRAMCIILLVLFYLYSVCYVVFV